MSKEPTKAVYEIRKDGRVWVSSSVPNCGYTAQQLRSLKVSGFSVHKRGGSKDGGKTDVYAKDY